MKTSIAATFILSMVTTATACADDGSDGQGDNASSGSTSSPGASTTGATPSGTATAGPTATASSTAATTSEPTSTTQRPATTDDPETTGPPPDGDCGPYAAGNTLRVAHLHPELGALDVCVGDGQGCFDGPLLAQTGADVQYGDVAFVDVGVHDSNVIRFVQAGAQDCETPAAGADEVGADLRGDPPTVMLHPTGGSTPVVLVPLPQALDPDRVYAVLINGADTPPVSVAPDGTCGMVNPFFVAWDAVAPGMIGISPNGDVPYFNSAPPVEDYATMVCAGDDKLLTPTITLTPGEVSTFFLLGRGTAAAPYAMIECNDTQSQSCFLQ